MQNPDEGHYQKRLDDPCSFRVDMTSLKTTRREIVRTLKEMLFQVEILGQGMTGGCDIWVDWRIDDHD